MSFLDEIARDFRTMEGELKTTFAWQGSTYPCLATDPGIGSDLDVGGHHPDADLLLAWRLKSDPSDNFNWDWTDGSGPRAEQYLTFNGRVWEILQVSDLHGKAAVASLADPSRRP